LSLIFSAFKKVFVPFCIRLIYLCLSLSPS